MSGKLLIAGGAINPNNAEIYNTFINVSGGIGNAKIGIIAAASSTPVETAQILKDIFTEVYGLSKSQIIILENFNDHNLKETSYSKLNSYGLTGLWFTGGDQRRLQRIIFDTKGKETELFRFLIDFYSKEGIIGGTSAGAAIMCNPILTGGHSKESLFNFIKRDSKEDKTYNDSFLTLGNGLGIFRYGIIDQHFGERDRLGRLVLVCSQLHSFGFGIDENTALLVDGKNQFLQVLGSGGLTIVDARNGEININEMDGSLSKIKLCHLRKGDLYNLVLNKPTFLGEESGVKITHKNYKTIPSYESSYQAFIDLICRVNINGREYIETSSFKLENSRKEKIIFTFKETKMTKVYLSMNKFVSNLSAEDIEMSITFNDTKKQRR